MTSLNWERAAEQERYRRVPREKISSSCKTKKISNAQKKLISAMTKERGMKWDTKSTPSRVTKHHCLLKN